MNEILSEDTFNYSELTGRKQEENTNEKPLRDYNVELYAMFRRQKREHMLSYIHYER